MQDQVATLKGLKVNAAMLSSKTSQEEQNMVRPWSPSVVHTLGSEPS